METASNKKKVLSRRAIFIRIFFIVIYIIVLYFLYLFLIDLGTQHWVIIILLLFLTLIVIGPLITGITKTMYRRLFPKKGKRKKPDFQVYKEQLKAKPQTYEISPNTKNINLEFKYHKSIVNKCPNCGMTIPNFVKVCLNCGKPISD